MIGELIGGRYRIERELGRGAMGVVYLAQDTRLPRKVALKMLDPELTGDANLRQRLQQEARAAAALNHPGIATVFDFDQHQGASFIVFEYVEGARLRDSMQQGRLRTAWILDIAMQMADALAAAHDRGIVHRDLKPENVMLAPGSQGGVRVRILDFGLAKLRQPLQPAGVEDSAETAGLVTGAGLVVGTINYMSPEQLAHDPVDGRADLFALGLVLYEMAAGAHPFAGKSVGSTIANLMKQEAPPLAGRGAVASPEFERILRKLLRKRREERFASARDLYVDLSNLRQDLSLGGPAPAVPAAPPPATPSADGPGSGIFSRGPARAVFAAIQAGYLAMYLAVLVNLALALEHLAVFFGEQGVGPRTGTTSLLILMTALAGIAVRLYLFSAVAADYPGFGVKYRVLFPFLFAADLFWALAPLLLHPRIDMGLTLAAIAALAYLPFVQRRLVYDAYLPRGGRTSAVRAVPG